MEFYTKIKINFNFPNSEIIYNIESNSIFHVYMKGNFILNDITNYLNEFKKIESLPDNLLLLYDLREANLTFSLKELQIISNLADSTTNNYSRVKSAFLVDKPKESAYSVMFSDYQKSLMKMRKVFSSEEIAITWLLDDSV